MNAIIRDSCRSILVEVATFFTRYGVSYKELQEILKESFVEAEIRANAKESTRVSAVAISEKTGISRKFISKYRSGREESIKASFRTENSVPTGVLLKIWHNDPEFLDREGRPSELQMGSDAEKPSFTSLVAKTGDQRAPKIVFDELLVNGSVILTESGAIRVVSRTLIMGSKDESIIKYFGIAGSNLLSTLVYNTGRSDDEAPHFERTTWVSGISKETFRRFSELVSETSVPFLELLDDWLAARQNIMSEQSEDQSTLGVGIYVFDRNSE